MIVLVGCEESQEITMAFRKLGIEAYSNDLKFCSGGYPEYHLQMDVYKALDIIQPDLFICHPDCTKLAVSGNAHYAVGKPRYCERLDACKWTEDLWKYSLSKCKRVVFENPVGVLPTLTCLPMPHYIQPFQFGHPESKRTGLFYFNTSILIPTNILALPACGYWNNQDKNKQNKLTIDDKWISFNDPRTKELRSKTYPGIAHAMASQWSNINIKQLQLF